MIKLAKIINFEDNKYAGEVCKASLDAHVILNDERLISIKNSIIIPTITSEFIKALLLILEEHDITEIDVKELLEINYDDENTHSWKLVREK